MKCKKFDSLIGSYLDGTIPDDQREIFEEHYFICDECYASLVLVENLRNKNVRIVPEREKNYSFVFRPAMLIASLVLVVFVSLFFTDLNIRNGELMEISAFSPPLYIKGENRGDHSSNMFYTAMSKYQNENYQEAYKDISTLKTGNPQIWYFRGILALLNGNHKDALVHFNLIISAMSPSYYDEALYYRGICYIRMNRKKDALKEFRTLESMFSPLKEKAAEKAKLLSEL